MYQSIGKSRRQRQCNTRRFDLAKALVEDAVTLIDPHRVMHFYDKAVIRPGDGLASDDS